MPFQDISDGQRRFKPLTPPPVRPRVVGGFHNVPPANVRANFPGVGATLSAYHGSGTPQSPAPPPYTSISPQTTPAAVPIASPLRPKPKRRWRIFTKKRIVLALIALVLAGGIWVSGKLVYNSLKVFHGSVFNLLTTTKLKGEDTGRVNILLAGNSADDPGHDGANLTDSIMIVSIDVQNHTAFLLSVPRDLWVDIPGYGHAKINEAYVDGQAGSFSDPGFPKGGMGLLEEVVEQNLGININYYGLIDYNAFRDAVDAVGGVDVNIQSPDPRGLYDPSIDWTTHGPLVRLTNGVHHLTGEQALDLARARGDAYGSYGFPRSDFDRTEHQREMLLALKSKVASAGVLANPIALGNLFDSVGKNVSTDFTLGEVRRLYDIGKNIANTSIQSVGLNDANGQNLLANYTSPNGESALIPAAGIDDFSTIKAYLTRLTSNNPVLREGANVVVLNGTNVSGLAARAKTTLMAKDITVSAVGDAVAPSTTTTIIDTSNAQKPATLQLLKQLYGTNVTTANPYDGTYNADFIIVLGNDQTQPATTTQ